VEKYLLRWRLLLTSFDLHACNSCTRWNGGGWAGGGGQTQNTYQQWHNNNTKEQ
jgi:hypothetical protein